MKLRSARQPSAFSLVLCLIILTLLALPVIGFLSTTALDRSSSRASVNKSIAESAARTAVNQATSLLAEQIVAFPDSVTVWEQMSGPAPVSLAKEPAAAEKGFEGTVLYTNDRPNDPMAERRVLPLVSRPDRDGQLLEALPIKQKAESLGAAPWTNENSIDLNRPASNSDQTGWIGTRPDGVRREYRARWIEHKSDAEPGQPSPVVSRYAFWMEDESFRLNLNLLGEFGRGSEAAETFRDAQRATLPAQHTPMQGLLRSLRAPVNRERLGTDACRLRDAWLGRKLWDLSSFNHADAEYSLGDQARFLGTIHSGGLNLSRHGTQRVNLNAVVGVDAPGFDRRTYNPSDAEILEQIARIREAIRFHTSDAAGAMKFGQRFYRTSFDNDGVATNLNAEPVSSAHQDIYHYKLAANIRDYIDPDLQPTIVSVGQAGEGSIARGIPTSAINANAPPAEIWAQGKDGAPFLQEAVVRYRTSVAGRRYSLKVDYYIEFWNMGASDVYAREQTALSHPHALGGNAFVRIANQQAWVSSPSGARLRADNLPAGDPTQAPQRDLVIDLNEGVFCNGRAAPGGVVFKAGACTVITTDPDYLITPRSGPSSPSFSGGYHKDNIYYCSKLRGSAKREYAGPLPNSIDRGIKPDFRDGTQDYDTEVILGNDLGIIDSHPAAVAMGGSPIVTTSSASRDDWYGGSLLGNGTTRSQLGDPRTNNEQLDYVRFSGTSLSEPDQGRYWNSVNAPRFSLGYPNERYVNPHFAHPLKRGWIAWPDHYKGWDQTFSGIVLNQPNERNAPAFIANGKLHSIGQLGDVFDPARSAGGIGRLGVSRARGGGRTLRIGQPDDLADMSRWFTNSQQWASWRLADFLSVSSEMYLPGLININGLARDDGAALRAACYGLDLHIVAQAPSAVAPTVADVPLVSDEAAPVGLSAVIDDVLARLGQPDPAKPSYFRERGEFSELQTFNSELSKLSAAAAMRDAFDRSREELVRRLLEMITTRGNVFSVYAVGQAVKQQKGSNKVHVTAEHWMKVTFALLPRKADGGEFQAGPETFDPWLEADLTRRFSKPDHYDIEVLQVDVR